MADSIRSVWVSGYSDPDCWPGSIRSDRTLGHQGGQWTAGSAFGAYIRDVLIPKIEPDTVVSLDTLATYRNKEAEALLRAHGCWFLLLPPYSPDLNPIEMAFAKLKARLRRIGARSFTGLFKALSEICELYTPQECWNYIRQAEHAST